MEYLLAFILPPVAILVCGKPIQALVNFVMVILGFLFPPIWLVCLIHALLVVSSHKADQRTDRMIKALEDKRQ